MELSSSKKLINFFYALNKSPLGETGCLNNHYFFLASQASSFLIVTYKTLCNARDHHSHFPPNPF